jgi:hypothetical protein
MRTQKLQSDVNKTFTELAEIISSFNEDEINLIRLKEVGQPAR